MDDEEQLAQVGWLPGAGGSKETPTSHQWCCWSWTLFATLSNLVQVNGKYLHLYYKVCCAITIIVLLLDLISNLNCEVLLKLMYQPFRENLWPSGFTMACSTASLLNTVLHCTARQVWIADPPSWRETTQLGVNQTQWPGFEGHGICTFLLVLTKLLFENMFLSENHPSLEGHDFDLYNSELTIL